MLLHKIIFTSKASPSNPIPYAKIYIRHINTTANSVLFHTTFTDLQIAVQPSQSFPKLSCLSPAGLLCLKRLGYKITKTVKKNENKNNNLWTWWEVPLYFPHAAFSASSTIQQLLLLHQHPQHSNLEGKPFPCSSGPLSLSPRNIPCKLPFAFLFSTSSSTEFSFKTGQQASPFVAPPTMYLLQKSSHSPWEHPNKLIPSSFALIWPRCCQPYFSFPIGFHSTSICLIQIQCKKSSCFPINALVLF